MAKDLTSRQEAFCEAYALNGGNGAAAARAAGYPAKNARFTARDNLTKPHLLARVTEIQHEVLKAKGDSVAAARIALHGQLADPETCILAARVILDMDLKGRALDLRVKELALKHAGSAGEATARVVPMPVRAKGVADFRQRAREAVERGRKAAGG